MEDKAEETRYISPSDFLKWRKKKKKNTAKKIFCALKLINNKKSMALAIFFNKFKMNQDYTL